MDTLYKKTCNFFLLTLRIICICAGFSLATNTFAAISISATTPTADGSFTLTWSGVTVRYQLNENGIGIDGGTTATQKLISGKEPGTYVYQIIDYCYPVGGGGQPVDCGTSTTTVNVGSPSPAISPIANVTTNEDTSTQVNVNFTYGGSSALSFAASSSNTALISGLTFSGSGSSMRTLTVTPSANASGSSVITVTIQAGTKSVSTTFTVTVNAVDDAPVISAINSQTLSEDSSVGLSFSVTDIDSPVGAVTVSSSNSVVGASVSAASSPNYNLQLSAGLITTRAASVSSGVTISVAGSSVTRLIPVTVMNRDPELTIKTTGTNGVYSLEWKYGSQAIRILENGVLMDGGASKPPSGAQSVTKTTGGTYSYSLQDCDGSAQGLVCSGGYSPKNITVTFASPTVTASIYPSTINEGDSATLTWSSTNATSCSATNISGVSGLSGYAPFYAPTVMSTNQTVNIVVTCTGNGGSTPQTVPVTVNWINDKPSLTIASSVSAVEDTQFTIPFSISDEETSAASLSVTASSADASKIASVTVDRVNNRLVVTPAANAYGTGSVIVRVTDTQGLFDEKTVGVTIAAVDDAPVISVISNQTLNETTSTNVAFTVTDVDSSVGAVSVSAANTSVIVPELSGSGSYSLKLTAPRMGSSVASQQTSVTVSVPNSPSPVTQPFTVIVNNLTPQLWIEPTATVGVFDIRWDYGSQAVHLLENGVDPEISLPPSGVTRVTKSSNGTFTYALKDCDGAGGQGGSGLVCNGNYSPRSITVTIPNSSASVSSDRTSSIVSSTSSSIGTSRSALSSVLGSSAVAISGSSYSSRTSSSASSLVFKKYEAEAATVFSGVAITQENAGYSGTGYGDYNAAQGSFLEWNIVQDVAGSAQLLVHYSNGNAPSRPMDLFINGVKAGSKTFATTKSWTTWADEVYSVVLRAGTNQIKLVAATTATGANIDYIGVSEMQSVSSSASSANLVQSGSDFVTTIKNESAINPSPESMPEATYLGAVQGTSHVAGDGSFNYSIPLSLPSGINGMQPGLQLAYNSNAKNGLVGWGWSVGGLSVISRCNASMVRDGYTSGIQSADAYKYCLDGQRLVEVSPNEYRLESESFLRIKRSSNYWEVSSNSAVTSRYGYNSDGKLEDDQGQAYAWYLDRQTDLAGNSWTVSYAKTNSGGIQSHYPDSIAYKIDPIFGAINSVKFHYENRDDISVKYIAGVKVKTDKRLSKIELRSAGNAVSTYNLTYQKSGQSYQGKPYSDPAKTSRLASVNQCFGSSATLCTASVEFDWNLQTKENYLFSVSNNTSIPNIANSLTLDINGDGVLDTWSLPNDSVANGGWIEQTRYMLNPYNPSAPATEQKRILKPTYKVMDINRDGFDDVVKEFKTINGLEVYLSNGNSLNTFSEPSYKITKEMLSYQAVVTWAEYIPTPGANLLQDRDPDTIPYRTAFADVNGDGLPDLVRSPYECSGPYLYCKVRDTANGVTNIPKDISVALNTGFGFSAFRTWYANWSGALPNCSTCEFSAMKLNFVDLNGDSAIDFLATAVFPDLTQHAIAGYNNGLADNGGAFAVESLGINSARDQLMGDFNGDGLIDIAKMPMKEARENATSLPSTYIAVNLGVGKPVAPSDTFNNYKGFADIVYSQNNTPLLQFCGNSRMYSAAVKDTCFRTVKDFNGDGLDDIVEWGERATFTCDNGAQLTNEDSCSVTERTRTVSDSLAHVYLSIGGASTKAIDFSDPIVYRNAAVSALVNSLKSKPYSFDDYNLDGAYEDDYRLKNNIKVNRIDAVIESGRRVGVDYESLASNEIYKIIHDDQSSEGFISNSQVLGKRFGVKKIEITNGAGGTNKTEYKYFGAKTHGAGYGDLGFAQIEKLETVEGKTPLKTITSYYQKADSSDYKLAGKIKRQQVYTSNTNGDPLQLLSDTRNQWKVRIYSDDVDSGYKSPHYFAYLYKSSSQQWDLDGTKIADAQIQNQKDAIASCDSLAESPAIVVTSAGSAADNDYTTEGVLVYSQTATCDQSGSAASVQIKAVENLDITQKGNARGLVQKQKAYAWVGTAVSAATKSAYDARTQSFTYNTLGQLESKTIEPDALAAAAIKLTTTYGYNGLGSVNSVTETWDDTANDGLDVVTRTTSINESYDSAGVRTVEVTSPLNLKETTKFHAVWGSPTSEIDANGLETKRAYDAYGRLELITYADATTTSIAYRSCNGCSSYHSSAKWYQQIKTTGSAAVRTYYDGFNREIGTRSKGLKGQDVYTWQSYNSRGDVYQTAEPFFYGGSQQTVTRTYDALGRVSNVSYPDSSSDVFTYNGLRHTTTNRLNQTQTRYLNAAGWVIRSQDNANTPVDFTYWPWGDLKTSQVNSDVKTQVNVVYDKLGRKTEMTDPNTGKTTYTYNALGLVATQTDAKNQRTCFGYDALGRQVKRVDKASNSCTGTTQNWYYDTSTYGKGQLASLSGVSTDGSSYSEAYSYTNKGLPETTSYSMGVNSYSVTQHYDSFSRPLGVTYPTGYVVANRYNSYGHLSEVADSAGVRVWKADDADALGNLKQFTLGNGVVTNQTYDAFNNRIETIRAVKGSVVIQDQRYQFDSLGNLTSREDRKNVVTQSFCYDGLNRLKAARFNGCSSAINDYVYDALGNLTAKVIDEQAQGQSLAMGYGTNGTNVAGPHAVTSANGWTYKYDAIGNLETATKTGESTRTVQYSPFNTPTSITQGSKFSTIVYGPNQDRIKHSDSNGRVTKYVGGIYEEVTLNGETQKIHYVGDMALFISKGENTSATYGYEYLHRDHVGSIVALSKGTVASALDVQWQANGAWGERRYQQWNGPLDNMLIPLNTARGFTDHEHLDSVGLIHMNGRVYDPELGRFMSADPFVQAPYNTQSYNRYSYVFNNPLSFTDPSGYECYNVNVGSETAGGAEGSDGNRYHSQSQTIATNGSLCGQDAFNFAFDWQNQVDRFQNSMVNVGGFIGGVGYVSASIVDQMLVSDALGAIDSALNGDVSGAVYGAAVTFIKPLKGVEKVVDLAKDAKKTEAKAKGALDTGRSGALNQAKRDLGIPRNQHPDKQADGKQYKMVDMTDMNGKRILGPDGLPLKTREYTYTRSDGSKVIIQDHSAGHRFNQGGAGDQDSHFNVRPPENTRTGKVPGTQEHYNF